VYSTARTMKLDLHPGMTREDSWVVSPSHLYNPTDLPGREVLSSPSMIMEMENSCAALAREHLADSQTTVGYHVDVKHVAPASPGARLTTTATLRAMKSGKLTFQVEVRSDDRLIGTGIHRRAIVPVT